LLDHVFVGLQHIDLLTPMQARFDVAHDMVLAENMTITLDLPYLELEGGA